jgi:hypothetical protein
MPVWNPTRRELYYRTEDERIMVATYSVNGDSFIAGKARQWSPRRLVNLGLTPNFDIAPDGNRFAVLMPHAPVDAKDMRRQATLVLNFSDELRRRVPY